MEQHQCDPSFRPIVQITPWSLRSWPPLLWQADDPLRVSFHHLGTSVTMFGETPVAGQTVWAAPSNVGPAGMAWDWVQLAHGVVAIADPMSLVTNLRLLGQQGEVLTAHQAAPFLNELVCAMPWQLEVRKALGTLPN